MTTSKREIYELSMRVGYQSYAVAAKMSGNYQSLQSFTKITRSLPKMAVLNKRGISLSDDR